MKKVDLDLNFAEGKAPLVFINGKEASGNVDLSAISPDRIKSISVLKDKDKLSSYGEKGKNGVIFVTLLTNEEDN